MIQDIINVSCVLKKACVFHLPVKAKTMTFISQIIRIKCITKEIISSLLDINEIMI